MGSNLLLYEVYNMLKDVDLDVEYRSLENMHVYLIIVKILCAICAMDTESEDSDNKKRISVIKNTYTWQVFEDSAVSPYFFITAIHDIPVVFDVLQEIHRGLQNETNGMTLDILLMELINMINVIFRVKHEVMPDYKFYEYKLDTLKHAFLCTAILSCAIWNDDICDVNVHSWDNELLFTLPSGGFLTLITQTVLTANQNFSIYKNAILSAVKHKQQTQKKTLNTHTQNKKKDKR